MILRINSLIAPIENKRLDFNYFENKETKNIIKPYMRVHTGKFMTLLLSAHTSIHLNDILHK